MLKAHLRLIDVGGYTFRAISPRPATRARFSTNRFHDTWHILSDAGGASLLSRLMWSLAFQKLPGTLVVIDRPHLVTTPFDGDPADRIVIAPHTTCTAPDRLRALKGRLARAPTKTIRLHTFGLDREYRSENYEHRRLQAHERFDRRAGMLCYAAPPEILKAEAAAIARTGQSAFGDYHYLGPWEGHSPDGEVQLFSNFDRRVRAARVARRELGVPATPIANDELRWTVQRHTERVRERLRKQPE